MSFNNDRLGVKKVGENIKINIPLDLASTSTPKILQKEEVNGICTDDDNVCICRG